MTVGKANIMAVFAKGIKGGRLLALSFVLMFVILMVGCSNEVTADQRLVDVFIDLRVVDIAYGGTSPMARLSRHEVLKQHGFTRDEFLAQMQAVLDDERMWVPFQKAVNAGIDSLLVDKNEAQSAVAGAKNVPGDSKANPNKPQMPAHKGGVE